MNERNYQEICKKAEFLGYKPIPDPKAYREIVHINNDKNMDSRYYCSSNKT